MIKSLSGIIAYTVTPFSNDKVDFDVLYALIDQLIAIGVDAIAALGSAGECAYLDDEEWAEVAEKTINYVDGRLPVIVGISELTTKKAVARAVLANQLGADVIMVAPFSYYPLSESEIYDHYYAISGAVSMPIMVYNNPTTCGVDMSAEFMLSMVSNIEQISMIKESSGKIERMHQIYSLSAGQVPFFNGCNSIALEALNAGAAGWCTAAPCLLGHLPKKLLNAVRHEQTELARTLFYHQLPLLDFIVKEGLATSVKAGLSIKGIAAGDPRRPLKPLDEQKTLQLSLLLEAYR